MKPQPLISLHTWTLDSSPLTQALRIARAAGYDGIELRHLDFMRCRQAGMSEQAMVDLVLGVGLPVTVVGTENGLMYETGAERERLLDSLRYVCGKAKALDCGIVMIPPGRVVDPRPEAGVANLRACADLAAAHGLRLALEFSSRHPIINTVEAALAAVLAVDRDNCGLLLDTYHLHCSGGSAASLRGVPVDRLFTFQFSDAPPGPPSAGAVPVDRLPPGEGVVDFVAIFAALLAMGYRGNLSYEAPNPAQWERPPALVAREGLARVRQLLAQAAKLT